MKQKKIWAFVLILSALAIAAFAASPNPPLATLQKALGIDADPGGGGGGKP